MYVYLSSDAVVGYFRGLKRSVDAGGQTDGWTRLAVSLLHPPPWLGKYLIKPRESNEEHSPLLVSISIIFSPLLKIPRLARNCRQRIRQALSPCLSREGGFCSWLKCQWLSHACSRQSLCDSTRDQLGIPRENPSVTRFRSFSRGPLENLSISPSLREGDIDGKGNERQGSTSRETISPPRPHIFPNWEKRTTDRSSFVNDPPMRPHIQILSSSDSRTCLYIKVRCK